MEDQRGDSMWATQIESVPDDILRKYFTPDAPLGPLNARLVTHASVLELLTERDLANLKGQTERPAIVVGRRGSGKTSYLRKLGFSTPAHLFVELKTDKTFTLILSSINSMIRDSITVEAVATVWEGIIWNCLFWMQYKHGQPTLGRPQIHKHLDYVGIAECKSIDAVMQTLGKRFQQICNEAKAFALDEASNLLCGTHFDKLKSIATADLESRDEEALIVLDSLDDYPINTDDFKKALAGLLKCVGEFNSVFSRFQVRLCLPSELYWEFVEKISTNTTKDFSSQLAVRWLVGELLLAACRRFMIYLKLNHPNAFHAVRTNPLQKRSDADQFFDLIFPKFVTNLNGIQERTDKYLLRHTQLLPRQLIMILNEVMILNGAKTNFEAGVTPLVTERAISLGIRDVEDRVVEEIFGAFRPRYPEAKDVCTSLLPMIPKIFQSNHLARAVKNFGEERNRTYPIATIRRMLVEIGAVGKFDQLESPYSRGRFEYNMTSRLPVGADDRLCVHPLFSRVFDCQSTSQDFGFVLPWATDL
jgi:hypothetical protein